MIDDVHLFVHALVASIDNPSTFTGWDRLQVEGGNVIGDCSVPASAQAAGERALPSALPRAGEGVIRARPAHPGSGLGHAAPFPEQARR